ncbi:hypothetical protein T11_16714 [Trichinella zimbabwensis]|uniref:Uncharacterized protein n=1 Tax=Trichinella zimbabwensis TaxID=268475 RepID=A0A0V1HIH1_9BILA|nr:hypothetical protein T11_16714 [Trichinella zimbabwensis]
MQTGQRGSSENMAKLRRSIQYAISSEHAISEPLTALTALITFKRKACKNESNVCRFLSQVRRVHLPQILKPTFQEFCGKFDIKRTHARSSFLHDVKILEKIFFNCMIASMSHISACFVRFTVKLCKVRWSGDYLYPSDRPSVHCSQLFNDSGSWQFLSSIKSSIHSQNTPNNVNKIKLSVFASRLIKLEKLTYSDNSGLLLCL